MVTTSSMGSAAGGVRCLSKNLTIGQSWSVFTVPSQDGIILITQLGTSGEGKVLEFSDEGTPSRSDYYVHMPMRTDNFRSSSSFAVQANKKFGLRVPSGSVKVEVWFLPLGIDW